MEIEIKKTTEWVLEEWKTYTQSFNQVFHKTFNIDDFKHKYYNTIDGISYHSLLKVEENVIGSCTIIPYEYYVNNDIVRVGLATDVFISENHREDPYSLYRMYKMLKKELVLNDISVIIAVPNDTAYPYWKNVVKWKDVGYLNYYALPIRLGNVTSKFPKVLNIISLLSIKTILPLSYLIKSIEKLVPVRIDRSKSIIEKQRYTSNHVIISVENLFFSYRIVNEDGIKTCYLIDFYNTRKGKKDANSLRRCIKYIFYNEKIDLIIFVGQLRFFQFLLFKVPFKKEPKHLYFMTDILKTEKLSNPELILNMSNWDFGLFNYDVR